MIVPTTVMNQKKDYSISSFVYALISILIIPVGFLTTGLLTVVSLGLSITGIVLSRKTLKYKESGLAKAAFILSIISIVLTVLLGFLIIALALRLANSTA